MGKTLFTIFLLGFFIIACGSKAENVRNVDAPDATRPADTIFESASTEPEGFKLTERGRSILAGVVSQLLSLSSTTNTDRLKRYFTDKAWTQYQQYVEYQRHRFGSLSKRNGVNADPQNCTASFQMHRGHLSYKVSGEFSYFNGDVAGVEDGIFKVTLEFEEKNPPVLENLLITGWNVRIFEPTEIK
jgi:hypothetical protein